MKVDNKNKIKLNKVPEKVSLHWRYLHQDLGKTWREISEHKQNKTYKSYSKSTICRHMKKPIDEIVFDKRKLNKGGKRKLTDRDKRNILRQTEVLRKERGFFTTKLVKVSANISADVCDETVRRVLHGSNLRYLHSRKKGLLSRNDLRLRLNFSRKVKKLLSSDLWTKGIAFYLDGVGFTHKYNPYDQSKAPKTMAWRRKGEGLKFGNTAKGSHEGTGGQVAHFICAIGYGKGMLLAEQYHGNLSGQMFQDFIQQHFPQAFENSGNPVGKLFLQDGDPSQNSRKARIALHSVGARQFKIPPRSPDINPIENIFHLVKKKLQKDALDNRITKENFEQFSERVRETLVNFAPEIIDNTIASMDKRIGLIIKAKGQRIKY